MSRDDGQQNMNPEHDVTPDDEFSLDFSEAEGAADFDAEEPIAEGMPVDRIKSRIDGFLRGIGSGMRFIRVANAEVAPIDGEIAEVKKEIVVLEDMIRDVAPRVRRRPGVKGTFDMPGLRLELREGRESLQKDDEKAALAFLNEKHPEAIRRGLEFNERRIGANEFERVMAALEGVLGAEDGIKPKIEKDKLAKAVAKDTLDPDIEGASILPSIPEVVVTPPDSWAEAFEGPAKKKRGAAKTDPVAEFERVFRSIPDLERAVANIDGPVDAEKLTELDQARAAVADVQAQVNEDYARWVRAHFRRGIPEDAEGAEYYRLWGYASILAERNEELERLNAERQDYFDSRVAPVQRNIERLTGFMENMARAYFERIGADEDVLRTQSGFEIVLENNPLPDVQIENEDQVYAALHSKAPDLAYRILTLRSEDALAALKAHPALVELGKKLDAVDAEEVKALLHSNVEVPGVHIEKGASTIKVYPNEYMTAKPDTGMQRLRAVATEVFHGPRPGASDGPRPGVGSAPVNPGPRQKA